MISRYSVPLQVAAVTTAAAVVTLMAAIPATAADGDVQLINTETVQVYTSPTGEVETQRIYEQLALTGTGSVDLQNPISTEGLRNLDGFGGFDVEDGSQITKMSVDGEEHLRSVSDYTGKLPLEVAVEYLLDGERVEPGDVVGEDGELEVKFLVKNVTGVEQEVSFPDGSGGSVTKMATVPIPMVGSLSTVAPENFTEVASAQANMAGDGKGGTKMSFTMTLFPPIGSDTAEFGYTASITDGVVPRATITALPVNPLESPTFASAANSYQGGADTGIELTEGATEIDANLLKLRDGAGDLLAGLIKLRDGAAELEAGLAGVAAPGADLLADGATELNAGLGELNSGAGQLADGAGRLNDGAGRIADGTTRLEAGTGDALAGSRKLSDGLGLLSGGLAQLADANEGLPAAEDGALQLKAGVDLILSKLGTVNDPATLIGGLAKLETGLVALQTGAGQIEGGLQSLAGGLPTAKGGVDQVKAGLDASLAANGSLDQLAGGLAGMKGYCAYTTGVTNTQCVGLADQLIAGVGKSRTDLTAASGGLGQVSAGLGTAITGLNGQLLPGATRLKLGLGDARTGAGTLKEGAVALKAGVAQVGAGLQDLSDGLTSAVAGVLQLSSGSQAAYDGSSDLVDGLGLLDAGANELNAGARTLADGTVELSDGAGRLADGTGRAADGSSQIADGANKLSDGLGAAADGSGQLADGLGEAAAGAPKLEDGAQRLSDEGTSKLIEAGVATAQTYGELYATIAAGADRAQNEKMVIGAPEGAIGLAAYTFEIQGEDGEGSRNVARGLGGLAVLAAGAGAFALRRRVI